MPDFKDLQAAAKRDVDVALEVWTSILERGFTSDIEYAYAKGSATKAWDSPIDYVPVISDLDIHVKRSDGTFFHEDDEFAEAMNISREYEKAFLKSRPDRLHIPRTQLVSMQRLEELVNYVPPRKQDVKMLIGDFEKQDFPPESRIREIDRSNLLSDEEFLNDMPMMVVDRTGLDFWNAIRRMNWRVSPAPARLLSQLHDNPIETWAWNRSTIVRNLEKHSYDKIGELYTDFYMSAWDLFLSDLKGLEEYRLVVESGYYLLGECIQQLKRLE
ncbi:MAG: hypothetical protein ACOC38_11255 [Promethearchaeia archaeon]